MGAPGIDDGEESFVCRSCDVLWKCLEVSKRSISFSRLSARLHIFEGQEAHWSNNCVPQSTSDFSQLSKNQKRHPWESSRVCASLVANLCRTLPLRNHHLRLLDPSTLQVPLSYNHIVICPKNSSRSANSNVLILTYLHSNPKREQQFVLIWVI